MDAKDTKDDKEANVGRSRRGRKQLQGRQRAAADRHPEVHDPRRVFQRPPAQQEPPGARTSSRELGGQKPGRLKQRFLGFPPRGLSTRSLPHQGTH